MLNHLPEEELNKIKAALKDPSTKTVKGGKKFCEHLSNTENTKKFDPRLLAAKKGMDPK